MSQDQIVCFQTVAGQLVVGKALNFGAESEENGFLEVERPVVFNMSLQPSGGGGVGLNYLPIPYMGFADVDVFLFRLDALVCVPVPADARMSEQWLKLTSEVELATPEDAKILLG